MTKMMQICLAAAGSKAMTTKEPAFLSLVYRRKTYHSTYAFMGLQDVFQIKEDYCCFLRVFGFMKEMNLP